VGQQPKLTVHVFKDLESAALDVKGLPFDPSGLRPRWYSVSRWEFFLDRRADGTTRLLVRTGGIATPRRLTGLVNAAVWNPAHVIMQVRQFQQLRRRAEGLLAHVGGGELRHEVSAGVA
jgi:hypothetical protein